MENYKLNRKLLEKIFAAYHSAKHKSFMERFPTFDVYIDAVAEDIKGEGELLKKAFDAYHKANHTSFKSAYPDFNTFINDMDRKYGIREVEMLKKHATEGIRSLYKSDFDTLWKSRDLIPKRIEELKQNLANLGAKAGSSEDGRKLLSDIDRMEKAQSLVNAYQAVLSAETDAEIDTILSGAVPAPEYTIGDKGQPEGLLPAAENPFLKQVMPSAEYKTFELEGQEPSPMRTIFPEATRRAERGAGKFSTVIGGAKDLIRLPGRALRPLAKEFTGTDDPNISYLEEFARPDKYKTGAEEMFDEVLGFQGIPGGVARKGGTAAVRMAPRWFAGANKHLKFIDPTKIVYRGIGKVGEEAVDLLSNPVMFRNAGKFKPIGDYSKSLLSGAVGTLPGTGFDAAYEATRAGDEQSNPYGVAAGGLIGGALAKPMGEGIGWLMGRHSDATKELLSGSKYTLQDKLDLARIVTPREQLTSLGGRDQLDKFKNLLPAIRTQLAKEREELGDVFSGTQVQQTRNDILGYLDLNASAQPQNKYSWFDDPSTQYIDEISKTHPSKRKALMNEFQREYPGFNVPNRETLSLIAQRLIMDNSIDDDIGQNLLSKMVYSTDIPTAYAELRKFISDNKLKNMDVFQQSGFEMFDMNEAIKTRTKLRQYGEGEGLYGARRGLFQQAEDIQKNVMDKQMSKSTVGAELQNKYKELANNFGLDDKLISISDPSKLDKFFNSIANARLNLSTKANIFEEAVELQNKLNKATGLKEDFITPAILRQLQSVGYWRTALGDDTSLGMRVAKMAGSWFAEGITRGKIRSFFAQIENLVDTEPDEGAEDLQAPRKRQKALPMRPQREEMARDVSEAEDMWKQYMDKQWNKKKPSGQ